MRILLTGATGFLGSKVTKTLAEHGHHLTALVRPQSARDTVRSYVDATIVGDVSDPVLMSHAADGHEAIVHMAADLSHWRRNRARIFRTNVVGTRVVAEAAKTAGVATLLHVSSIAAVGYSVDGSPLNERAPNNFAPLRLVYHETKRLAEEEAREVMHYGTTVIIVNPGVLYGPRSLSHTFGHAMLELYKKRIPGHPTGGLSVTDVDDAAAGIVNAITRGKNGERYLLAGANLTYAEVFRRLAKAAGTSYEGRPISPYVMRAAAIFFETQSHFNGREPRITIDNAKIAPLFMWYDSSKAERELGYRKRAPEETFDRMARVYRDAGLIG